MAEHASCFLSPRRRYPVVPIVVAPFELGDIRAVDVLARAVSDNDMLFHVAISGMIVSCDQAGFFRIWLRR
jgi:hypothetical protein